MGGGLMQLVAYGAQDIYLTGNPQITFFKVVYRRHTNFSMESIEQTINGTVGPNSRVTSTISRNGDLVYRLFYDLAHDVAVADTAKVSNLGSAAFENVEIEIGGQRIDRITGQWINVWYSLTEENTSRVVADTDGASGTLFQELAQTAGCITDTGDGDSHPDVTVSASVPLPFWFCRNPGLALPLIALQYHEVKVVTTFAGAPYMPAVNGTKLWADYIYLDTDERRRFAQVSHEYLIEQVQFQAAGAATTSQELNFNHPVKELIWTGGPVRAAATGGGADGSEAIVENHGTINTLEAGDYYLKLNGHDRMAARPLSYFTKQQVWMHHTGPGGLVTASGTAADVGKGNDSIAVYSFALKPEEHQPSGTCNFSRIDNAQLVGPSAVRDVFAVNYNVLRIMSGMGGLAYSN